MLSEQKVLNFLGRSVSLRDKSLVVLPLKNIALPLFSNMENKKKLH